MKKALDAPTATGRIKRCGTCLHGSSHFKIIGKTHLHCQHTDEKVAGEPGWGTLRNWFDKGCAEWESREEAQKMKSEKRLFLFFREGGFYPLELPKDTVADNAKANTGTIKVVDALTQETVWEANPHRGSEFCDVCYGATMIPSDHPNGDVMNTRCPKCNPPLNAHAQTPATGASADTHTNHQNT